MIVKYFGSVAESVNLKEEEWSINEITVSKFKEQLIIKHPQLTKQTIQIAINLVISDPNSLMNNNDTVAVLPPFSGG